MDHRQRWTPEKIKQRLKLIEPDVYKAPVSTLRSVSGHDDKISFRVGQFAVQIAGASSRTPE